MQVLVNYSIYLTKSYGLTVKRHRKWQSCALTLLQSRGSQNVQASTNNFSEYK